MTRVRSPALLTGLLGLVLLAHAAGAGIIEEFNQLLARGRAEGKDVFLVVLTPVDGAEAFARLLSSDQMRRVYQARFLAFPLFLGDLAKIPPEERARLAALLELYQAEPGPHPVFVFLRPDGVAYSIARPTLADQPVDVTPRMMEAIFAEGPLKKARNAKAAFLSVLDAVVTRPPDVAARELSGLLEKLPDAPRRLPAGKRALGALLQRVQDSQDPSLVALEERWQAVALRDAQEARLWQVRRLAWAADIQGAIDTADDLCRTSRDPWIQREACLSGTHLLVAIGQPGSLAKAKELLRMARAAAVALGEAAADRDPVTGIPGATPESIDQTLIDVEEARAQAHGATSKVIGLGP